MKRFIENNIDIFDTVGEKCKEERREKALYSTAREFYLHQAINNQTKK